MVGRVGENEKREVRQEVAEDLTLPAQGPEDFRDAGWNPLMLEHMALSLGHA